MSNQLLVANGQYQRQNFSCIYKIQSKINGRMYIGSALHFGIRRRNHVHTLKFNKHHSIILQRHVNKYGLNDLFFEILEIITDKFMLQNREQYYLDLYNPYFNVLKIAFSSTGKVISEETRQKLRDSHKGYKPSKDTLEKRSATMKILLSSLSKEEKSLRTKSAKDKKGTRKVICTQTGIIYNSMVEAERKTGCDNIWMICTGIRKHSFGLTFKYYPNE